jgi:hypothetical protein
MLKRKWLLWKFPAEGAKAGEYMGNVVLQLAIVGVLFIPEFVLNGGLLAQVASSGPAIF